MRKIGVYLLTVLIVIVLVPTIIVKTFNFLPKTNAAEINDLDIDRNKEEEIEENQNQDKLSIKMSELDLNYIKVQNTRNNKVEELLLDEYVKGVVAAEMPAEFHIEALKSQAIAARTYAISRSIKYKNGHPDHKAAPLCSGIHCQAYYSLEELGKIHGDDWVKKYWGKIEEAVESTKNLIIYYQGEIIEPLYHSTSGGMTEDCVNVFSVDTPYLKSVASPFEEDAPKYKDTMRISVEEFISILKTKYKNINITRENFLESIKLVEKTPSGRVKKLAIEGEIIDGREIRSLFSLNSTNFKIVYDKNVDLIEIETLGYGHGVGMSQWGANGMAKKGKTYMEILTHYYIDTKIDKM